MKRQFSAIESRMSAEKQVPADAAIEVDIIIPVHNAAETIRETVKSALGQVGSKCLSKRLTIYVCCYDDGSTDDSLTILRELKVTHENQTEPSSHESYSEAFSIQTHLLIETSSDGVGRGAGYARNRAVGMRNRSTSTLQFLCLLDSDDIMHQSRVEEQVQALLSLPADVRKLTLLGCRFDRDPPGSTWHYTDWANKLTDERRSLERFREVTLLQPTWMIGRRQFDKLGGYIEAPHPNEGDVNIVNILKQEKSNYPGVLRLIHPEFETTKTLRVAEDLRFFHAHLHANGILRCHQSSLPLVTYRHRANMSQSSQTPRKLLLQLRARAFEDCVLENDPKWRAHADGAFVIWGAGRDGKEFLKALRSENRKRVHCFVDVDGKKIDAGHYMNREIGLKIPILHFSYLVRDDMLRERLTKDWRNGSESKDAGFGKISKSKPSQGGSIPKGKETKSSQQTSKRRRLDLANCPDGLDLTLLQRLPVVVCVAMYRTNGALEHNVGLIGRTEGEDLWHFS